VLKEGNRIDKWLLGNGTWKTDGN
jgi:hypothetical protein